MLVPGLGHGTAVRRREGAHLALAALQHHRGQASAALGHGLIAGRALARHERGPGPKRLVARERQAHAGAVAQRGVRRLQQRQLVLQRHGERVELHGVRPRALRRRLRGQLGGRRGGLRAGQVHGAAHRGLGAGTVVAPRSRRTPTRPRSAPVSRCPRCGCRRAGPARRCAWPGARGAAPRAGLRRNRSAALRHPQDPAAGPARPRQATVPPGWPPRSRSSPPTEPPSRPGRPPRPHRGGGRHLQPLRAAGVALGAAQRLGGALEPGRLVTIR